MNIMEKKQGENDSQKSKSKHRLVKTKKLKLEHVKEKQLIRNESNNE